MFPSFGTKLEIGRPVANQARATSAKDADDWRRAALERFYSRLPRRYIGPEFADRFFLDAGNAVSARRPVSIGPQHFVPPLARRRGAGFPLRIPGPARRTRQGLPLAVDWYTADLRGAPRAEPRRPIGRGGLGKFA